MEELIQNILGNLFKPLLLFFYLGLLIPLLRVPFEFPKAVYQALTMYLLLAIGWHGGQELAGLGSEELVDAAGLMVLGFCTNLTIGVICYGVLRRMTALRAIDAATVAGYYGSDSAGTFVTCVGVLGAMKIGYASYMPVMLAVMEIPGCLLALYLVARLRRREMDAAGNLPSEPGHDPSSVVKADPDERVLDGEMLREVFLNPGLYLLFGGIVIGFVGRIQGEQVVAADNVVFVQLFHGLLCLFLLEMGITAARRFADLRTAGLGFIAFALIMPPLLGTFGCLVLHAYSGITGASFEVGTYALFAVLCAAASYIALPAVQRTAIPEASPTLPLAASLGVTFTFNVTLGIPIYLQVASWLLAPEVGLR